jgi:hypothetical protein
MEWIGPIEPEDFDAVKAAKEMKKGSLATPGLLSRALQSEDSPVSQSHGIQRERIRRLIGKSRCTFAVD